MLAAIDRVLGAAHRARTRHSELEPQPPDDEVPEDVVAAERETLETISRNEGKPEQAIEKIVEGRLTGFFRENTLMEQKFIKDEKQSIADLVGGGAINRFAQVVVGA